MTMFLKNKIIYLYIFLYFVLFLIIIFCLYHFLDINLFLLLLIINLLSIFFLVFVYYYYIKNFLDSIFLNEDKIIYKQNQYFLKDIKEIQVIKSWLLTRFFDTWDIKIFLKEKKDTIYSKNINMPYEVAINIQDIIKKLK